MKRGEQGGGFSETHPPWSSWLSLSWAPVRLVTTRCHHLRREDVLSGAGRLHRLSLTLARTRDHVPRRGGRMINSRRMNCGNRIQHPGKPRSGEYRLGEEESAGIVLPLRCPGATDSRIPIGSIDKRPRNNGIIQPQIKAILSPWGPRCVCRTMCSC
jgi:hypothetical protein